MKYYTWKTKWENNEGTDPTVFINNDTTRIEPVFSTGDLKDPNTLVYCYLLTGTFDASQFTDWDVKETTLSTMLTAAQQLDANATVENEKIKFSPSQGPQ